MRRRLRLKTALGTSISSVRGIEPRRSSPSRRRFAASSGSVLARSTKALRDTKGHENAAWRDAPHKWHRAAREKARAATEGRELSCWFVSRSDSCPTPQDAPGGRRRAADGRRRAERMGKSIWLIREVRPPAKPLVCREVQATKSPLRRRFSWSAEGQNRLGKKVSALFGGAQKYF